MQRGIAGALRVILMCDRRAEQRHDTIAGVLVNCSLETVNTVGKDPEEPVEHSVPFFRIMPADNSIDPLRSANSTVTCLRSPSRALREVRIFSARCLGVYDCGSRTAVPCAPAA